MGLSLSVKMNRERLPTSGARASAKVTLRLTRGELLALDRPPEIGLEREAMDDARVHRLVEDDVTRLAEGLGPIHRRIRVAEHLHRAIVAGVADRDADTRRGEDLVAADSKRLRLNGMKCTAWPKTPGTLFESSLS